MALIVNRAKMTTATTGTGTLTLGSAVTGFQSFAASGVTNGSSVRYVIEEGNNWEIGLGTYTTAGTTLTRVPSQSSSGGAAITLAGAAVVFVTASSADIVPWDASTPIALVNGGTGSGTAAGARTNLGLGSMALQAASAVAITGGTIDGSSVGATTASSVRATTVIGTTSVLSSGAGGVGYATGAGVAVTQLTSRTTAAPTTGAKTCGAVTLFTTTAVVGTYFSFTVPNTAIAVTDTVVVNVRGATNTYVAFVSAIVAATSFTVTMASVAGTASDTPIVNFSIIKSVSA